MSSLWRDIKKRFASRDWVSTYLTLYNCFASFVNLVVLVDLVTQYRKGNFVYSNHVTTMFLATGLQLWDIFNAWKGYTTSNIRTTVLQVFGRLFVLYFAYLVRPEWRKTYLFVLLANYILSEIVRYPFYTLKTYGQQLWLTTWLRYNSFIVLYPIGFFCEAMVFYHGFLHFWSLNHQFKGVNTAVALVPIIFVVFPYFAVSLFSHMWNQRKTRSMSLRKRI